MTECGSYCLRMVLKGASVVCGWVDVSESMCLSAIFLSIKNECRTFCSPSFILASVAFPALVPSLFQGRLPKPRHTHTHTPPNTFFPPCSWLSSHLILYDPPTPSLSELISSKVSSQVTLTLISLTAAKHRRLERTHCLEHTH